MALDTARHGCSRWRVVTSSRLAVRTVIDELSTPVSALRTASRHSVQRIWTTIGQPLRGGMGPWYPYETLAWERQQTMLEAAATILRHIETGEADGHGTLAPILTPKPYRPVPDGTPPAATPRNYWQEAMEAADMAITLAQDDPDAARQLLTTLTALSRTEATFQRIRDDLLTLGIPDNYLPQTLAETAAGAPSPATRA